MTKKFWANLALSLVLGSLAIVAVTKISSALTPKGLFITEPQPSAEAAQLLSHVFLVNYDLVVKPDHMYEASFQISNKSHTAVKNINVLCEFTDKEGQYADRQWWKLNEVVPPAHTINISSVSRRFVSTKIWNVGCRVANFELVEEPFFSLDKAAGGGHGSAGKSDHDQAKPSAGAH